MVLAQLGIGPDDGFVCTGKDQTWTDYLGDFAYLEAVKTFIYLKTRLVFDPPQNSFLVSAIQDQITELTWRLNVRIEQKGRVN